MKRKQFQKSNGPSGKFRTCPPVTAAELQWLSCLFGGHTQPCRDENESVLILTAFLLAAFVGDVADFRPSHGFQPLPQVELV